MNTDKNLENLEQSIEAFRKELTESAHIVLVDDDADTREPLVAMLTRRGMVVHAFSDAVGFLNWLGPQPAAVGIFRVDWDGKGFDLMKLLAKKQPLSERIALAAEPDAAMAVACLELGAQDLFALPVTKEDLFVSRVTAALERWRRAAIDSRISEQFKNLATSLFRKDDVKHAGALSRFAKILADHKKSLALSRDVLVVAENTYAGERTQKFLESEGYRASLAGTVKDAVEVAAKLELRLLLADAVLADGTAFDAYKDIQTVNPDVEFLVVSSANAADIAFEAMSRGARDCILKPHEGLEAIQLKVRRALRLQAQHAKHLRLVDELRKLCGALIESDKEALGAGSVFIKVDPGKSQATLNRFLADINREEQTRLRNSAYATR